MKHSLHVIVGLLVAAGASFAAAAPTVPSSVMPGRERDRFTQSPVERFMQGGPYQPPPVLQGAPCTKPHSKSRAARPKNC